MIPITTSEQKSLLAVCIVFTILPTLSFALRIYAGRMKNVSLSGSDYSMFVGLVGAYGVIVCNLVGILAGGMGEHEIDVSGPQSLAFLKSLLAVQLIWAVSLCGTKVSMCLFYTSIFTIRQFRIAAYYVMGASVVFALMVIIATLSICRPLAMWYDPTLPGGHCGNRNALWLAVGICNITTDLLVLSLPIPIVWNLKVPRINKVALSGIFGLGFFVCIVSIIRLKFLLEVDFTGDLTWTVVEANIWSLLEPTMAVFIGCLPTLAPLFRKIMPSSTSKGNTAPSKTLAVPVKRDTKNFHELDDVAPLTHITAASPSHGQRPNKSFKDDGDFESGEDNEGIHVVTEWDVERR